MLVPTNLFPPGTEKIVQVGSDELAARLAPIPQDRVLDRVAQCPHCKGARRNKVDGKYKLIRNIPVEHLSGRAGGRVPALKHPDHFLGSSVDILLYKAECLP